MLRYSIHQITYDYMEILAVYSLDEFNEIIKCAHDDEERDILLYNQINNDMIDNDVMYDNYEGDYYFDVDFQIFEDEVNVKVEFPVMKDGIQLKLPKLKDVLIDEEIPKKDQKDIIDFILIKNNCSIKKQVNESTDKSELFVEYNGKIVSVSDVDGYYFAPSDKKYKIGDTISMFNITLFCTREFKIVRILDNTALPLTDDIVKKINYNNIYTKEEFVKNVIKDYNEVYKVNNIIENAIKEIQGNNFIEISKQNYSLYKRHNKDLDGQDIYDLIEYKIASTKFRMMLDQDETKPKNMKAYFQKEYALMKIMEPRMTLSFDDFYDQRIEIRHVFAFLEKNGGE